MSGKNWGNFVGLKIFSQVWKKNWRVLIQIKKKTKFFRKYKYLFENLKKIFLQEKQL